MGSKKATTAGCIVLTALLLLMGCGEKEKGGPYEGKWAYIHDADKTAMRIEAEGQARLDGTKYSYIEDEDGLLLTDDDGEAVRVSFKDGENEVFVYKPMNFISVGTNDGVVGVWKCGNNSFEFTVKGTFMEDGYFPGYYFVDEEKGEIKLAYTDVFEDTVIPFKLTDEGLELDYPWVMVRKQ